jgi:tripartite-type tricarboxylate transporter receptor subunit TctC
MKLTPVFAKALAAVVGVSLVAAPALGQDDYPSKPITLLVGYATGGSADMQARLIADLAGKELKQRILVENKPGMSAAVMLNSLVRAKPDGYTIASTPAGALFANPFMLKVEYSHTDLTYIAAFGRLLQAVSVKADSQWKTFDDFVNYAKQNPGKARYASYAPNSTTHWLMRLVATDRGLDWTHVPYNSDGAAAQALLGGHVDAIAVASGQVPLVNSGQLRMLAVFNGKRLPQFPNVPTLDELGYKIPNLTQMTSLTGIVGPKGMPAPVVQKLTAALEKAYRDPAFEKLMRDISAPIDIVVGKAYEAEVAESYKVAEKILPPLVKESAK